MRTSRYLYAAVGAPVALRRAARERMDACRSELLDRGRASREEAMRLLEEWADEGERLVGRVGEAAPVDDLTPRMDLGQVQEQVHRLRDQLEHLVETWRASFRPAGGEALPATSAADAEPVGARLAEAGDAGWTPPSPATAAPTPPGDEEAHGVGAGPEGGEEEATSS